MTAFIVIVVMIVVLIYCYTKTDTFKNNEKARQEKRINDFNNQTKQRELFLSKHNMKVTSSYTFVTSGTQNQYVDLIVDDQSKNIAIFDFRYKPTQIKKIPFDKIIGCEIMIDSQVTGGVGRAVVGGVLAGSTGAVVGAVTAKKHVMSYKIVIYTNNVSIPMIEMNLINYKTSTKNTTYSNAVAFAENVNAVVKAIISQR